MPVRNGSGPFLAAALDGILLQDYSECSILISDNASTDDSLERIRERCAGDDRVVIRARETLCPADVHFQEVLALAPASEYFMWAADDDIFHPTFVSTCVGLLERFPTAVSAGSAFRLLGAHGETLRIEQNIHSIGMDLAGKAREIARRAGWYSFYNLMRRTTAESIPIPSVFGSDVLYTMKLLLRGDLVAVVDPLFSFRMPEKNLSAAEYLAKADIENVAASMPFVELFRGIVDVLRNSDLDESVRDQAERAVIKTIIGENAWLKQEITTEVREDLPIDEDRLDVVLRGQRC